MAKVKLQPLGDRVIAQAVKETKSPAGIILPTNAHSEKPERAVVVAVGKGRINDAGTIIPMTVKVGDEIVFAKYGPEEVKVDSETYFILREDQILAIVK
jgi:chaperonin GroES